MTKNFYIAAFVVSMLAFSSCKIGKRYVRPELNLPDRIEAYTDTTDTASVENIPWESLYADEALKDLIRKALDNNKDMKIAAAKVKEMIAAKRISFASMLPEVGANIYAQKERLNYGGDNPKPDPEFGAKLTLSWELDLWGNLRWANEAAIASYMETVEGQRALRLTIIAEVAANYYQLCALDQELSIVQQTLDARREGVRLAKLRYEGGLTSETAYNQAQVELARTETLIPSLERQIKIKESDLSMLLGEYTDDIPRGLSLSDQHLPDALPIGLPSSLLERRPDMRQAEFKLRAANAQVGVAQTDLFPKIRLTSNYGFESDELSSILKSPAGFIAGSLLQPIFAMGKNKAKVKAAKARYEQEVYSYEKSVLGAFKEVNNAIVTVRKVKEIRASRMNLEASASKYLELAQLQYINGVISYMDVLDAQAEFKLRAANAQVGVAQTDLFPKIRLTSNYGFESDELSSILKSPAGFIAGSLLQPIFAMGKNKAKVKAAKARYEQEVYSYEKSVLGAFKEVNNAIVTVRKVKEIRASRMNLEASASKYLELAQLQYINGVISYMDVLDAQRGLLDAQIGLNNAVLDELLSVVYLYKALGGGF